MISRREYANTIIFLMFIPCNLHVTVAIISRLTAIVADCLVLILTWRQTWRRDTHFSHARVPLTTAVLRDGECVAQEDNTRR